MQNATHGSTQSPFNSQRKSPHESPISISQRKGTSSKEIIPSSQSNLSSQLSKSLSSPVDKKFIQQNILVNFEKYWIYLRHGKQMRELNSDNILEQSNLIANLGKRTESHSADFYPPQPSEELIAKIKTLNYKDPSEFIQKYIENTNSHVFYSKELPFEDSFNGAKLHFDMLSYIVSINNDSKKNAFCAILTFFMVTKTGRCYFQWPIKKASQSTYIISDKSKKSTWELYISTINKCRKISRFKSTNVKIRDQLLQSYRNAKKMPIFAYQIPSNLKQFRDYILITLGLMS